MPTNVGSFIEEKVMYLSKLVAKNFRSLKDVKIDFKRGKNIIVGKNNSGKSNIISALDLVLGENSPTYNKSENITDLDFYTEKILISGSERIVATKEVMILCILQRDKDEELNYLEIDKCYGYHRCVKTFTNDDLENNLSALFKIDFDLLQNNVEKIYVDRKLKYKVSFKSELDDKYQFAFAFMAVKDDEGLIKKEIRFFYRESDDKPWYMCRTASIRNELLQSAIMSSFRDPSNQLRATSWTWFGKLMKYLTSSHGRDEDLKKAFGDVKAVADKIFNDARMKIQETSLNVAFPGAKIHFQFNEDLKADLYKDSKIFIDDGIKTPLSEKGSGIQSATIIGLFNFYTQRVNTKTSALLCMEEPELYLHPHARRVISDRLDGFLDNGKNQVILTTHSSEFIRTMDETLNMILAKKEGNYTTAESISIREYRYLLLDNNYNELFFADKVIICEGNDVYVLRWIADELFPGQLNEQNISLIMAGGKDQVSKFVRMAVHLKIKCFVFADFDYLLRDQSQNAKKLKQCHESLQSIHEAFWKQDVTYGKNFLKAINLVKKFREEIKKNQEQKFFLATKVSELTDKKGNYSIFLSDLRKHGVGILNGQIEDLSKNSTILSPSNKLDIQKVFQINEMIVQNGMKISDLLETSMVKEFLEHVFKT